MMQLSEFKTRTDKLNGGRRGSKMIKVDLALTDWWRDYATAVPTRKLELTLAVFSACKDWLKLKAGKKSVSFFGSINELLERRRIAVKSLACDALDVMIQLDPTLKPLASFDRHKVQALAKGTSQTATKSLESGYAHERSLYLSGGKQQNPVSGSGVHGAMKELGNDQNRGLLGVTLDKKQLGLVQKHQFEKLSLHDYLAIEELAKQKLPGGGGRVGYFKKHDRLKHLVLIDNGVFVDQHDQPYSTTYEENTNAYAIDGYGNLFVADGVGIVNDHVQFFNHSSFNAGKPVMAAGELTIVNGKLIRINNNSGHYKPTRENLHEAIKFFVQEQVDLSQANVEVKTPSGWDSYKASTFLTNPKAAPDGIALNFHGKRI